MKNITEIHSDILNKFSEITGIEIQEGTTIDDYSYAVSDALYQAYVEIENNKNPYLYSKINGANLDDLGMMVNCPREANEEDDSYLHRLIEWMISCETSNYDSIENALINLEYASNATYNPLTYGVGTATVYIIPNSYDDDTIKKALLEVKTKINKVKSAASYVEYVIPEQKRVSVSIHIDFEDNIDESYTLDVIDKQIESYVNNIAIGDYLRIGDINKLGINNDGVSYFVVLQLYLDDVPYSELEYKQTIYNKFVFDKLYY